VPHRAGIINGAFAAERCVIRTQATATRSVNDSTRRSVGELVEAYMSHAVAAVNAGGKKDRCFWAWEEVTELVRDDVDRAWDVVLELVGRAVDDRLLAYVAAGPLEDLIKWHPHEIIDRVEQQARRDARFRRALSGVWGVPSSIEERVRTILGDEPRL
jgi:Family of unknown function (DUF6869)